MHSGIKLLLQPCVKVLMKVKCVCKIRLSKSFLRKNWFENRFDTAEDVSRAIAHGAGVQQMGVQGRELGHQELIVGLGDAFGHTR